jgi:pimeloyl-ACP methyl ester carboxylesterase
MLSAFADGTILGERYGSGSVTVIALHGWRRTHTDFARVLDGLPGSIALDLPGFGATPPPLEAWGSAQYADAILPIIDDLDDSVIVLGHSFGGRVALHLANRAPTKIRGLVLTGVPQLAPSAATGRPNRRFQLIKAVGRAGLVSEHRVERARMKYGSSDYREAEGVMRGVLVRVLAERYSDLIAEITCPVELVWGVLDTAAPTDGARSAAATLPNGHLVVVEGVGHMVPIDAPEALRSAIDRIRT